MFNEATIHLLLALATVTLLVVTCWHDLATRLLPNGIAIALAALGIAWQVAAGDLMWSLIAATLVFLGATFVWYLRALGGGDVKLLTACALLPDASDVPQLLVMMALTGGVLALIYIAARRVAPAIPARPRFLPARVWRAEVWRMRRGGPLPYALPISFGTLFAMMGRV